MKEFLLGEIGKKNTAIIPMFMVEMGSRAWGTNSASSDRDIRFVYHYPKNHYLSLFDRPKDHLEFHLEDDSNNYDMEGWDIYKFLRLLAKSNPSTIEWLLQNPIYSGNTEVITLLKNSLSDASLYRLYRHYLSMAEDNYQKYLDDNIDPSLKIYIQVLRSIFSAIYIIEKKELPPLNMEDVFAELNRDVSETWDLIVIRDIFSKMLGLKRSSEKHPEFKADSALKFWIAEILVTLNGEIQRLEDESEFNSDIDKSDLENILSMVLES